MVLGLLLSVAALVAVPSPATAEAPVVTGTETDLGVQIPGVTGAVRSEQSAQGVLRDGRYLAFFASSGGPGTPARFFAMDLTGATVAEIAVPLGTQVLSLVYSPSSQSVFVAVNAPATAYLYEWTGGEDLLSRGVIEGHEAMRLSAAPDGAVYVGTFAPAAGRLYVYDDGRLTDLGQPVAGESYVRSLVADSTHVWVSNYRDGGAVLVKVDRATNARTRIATTYAFASQWSAFDMSRAGDYLFMRTVNQPRLFALNTVTGQFESFDDQVLRVAGEVEQPNRVPYVDGISPYGISSLLEGRYVYFQRSGAGIMRIDTAAGLKTIRVDKYHADDNRTSWPGASVPGPVSYAWLPGVAGRTGHALVTTTIDGKVLVNGPGQTGPTTLTLTAVDAPSTIISLGADGAGGVYTGGFDLPAGIGHRSAGATSTTVLPGPQIEGFGRFGSSVLMGGYTGSSTSSGPIYQYSGSGAPVLRTHLNNGQERPVAIQQVGTKVAIGSVPIKNTLGGALSIWDPATGSLSVKRDLIEHHSIISLSTSGGLVVGGSSNAGGTGSTPTATDGTIFTYDPATGALKTLVPPRAATATYSWVAAITPDPTAAGRFWALSTGFLVQFEVSPDGSITLTKNLGAFPDTSSPTGKELGIQFVGETLFATVGRGLSAINTTTGEQTVVAGPSSTGPVVGLVAHGDSLFYARGPRLYRYDVSGSSVTTDLRAPVVTSHDLGRVHAPGTFVFSGSGTKNSTVTLSDGTRSRSTLVPDGGTWTLGAIDFPLGSRELTFTASLPGFPSRVTTAVLTTTSEPDDGCRLLRPSPGNVSVDGYNAPERDYAFRGTGTPGALITMVSGTRTRTATVAQDGTWSMNKVWFGWWAGTVPFTATMTGCTPVTSDVPLTFATDPGYHVPPLLLSHASTTYYDDGSVTFSGKGTPGALITLDAGGQTRYAAVSPTGRWRLRAVTVGAAPTVLTFGSTLPGHPGAGLTTEVYFGTAPSTLAAPVLTSHSATVGSPAGSVAFAGKGTPNSKVVVAVGGTSVAGFVRANGRWDVPAVVLPAGRHTVTLTGTAPGLPSSSRTVDLSFD